MKIENYIQTDEIYGATGLFSVCGSFGIIDYIKNYQREDKEGETVYIYENNGIKLCATFKKFANGAVLRRDYFENLTGEEVEINRLSSRFYMDGNGYEVYTQYSGWQHESLGAWQKLVTQVTAETQGIRTCDGATPIMGLQNEYTGKITVFHLIPNCQWKMNARKFPNSDREIVVVETGLQDSGLKLKVFPGERIDLPEVIFYQAQSKIDLDAYKLHEVFNVLYPRRCMPIVYNSWLYCFDMLDMDNLKRQADVASELGFEAFMIDGGWFGKGENWFESVGDWEENLTGGPKGWLLELSEYIRNKGMRFGLWLEPERAFYKSDAVKNHPEFFIQNTFLNFADEKAREYILETVSNVMDKYKIGWVKFDYNATMPYDLSSGAFYRYWQGYRQFIKEFKRRYPDVYMTNCGGGGFRMELGQAQLFDSFWFTDNQGPYDGIRIVKDSLKRLPTNVIERWNVQKYSEGFLEYGNPNKIGRMLHCNNATWDFIIGVNDAFSEQFMLGGPFGFSCDIAEFPIAYKEKWKNIIAQYKKDRAFYMTATARILIDTESVIAIEYADVKLEKCIVQVFTKVTYAYDLLLYPVLDENAEYYLNGEKLSGKVAMKDGVRLSDIKNNNCVTYAFEKID